MKLNAHATLLGSSAIVSAMLMGNTGTWAQDVPQASDPNATLLETIIVQGDHIARRLQDTASSVAVVSEGDLEARPEQESVQQAIEDVPNVNYYSTVGTAPVIRGQDSQGPNTGAIAYLGGTVPRATINVDGQYLSYLEYVYGRQSTWDVQGIEVFRGPQTTSQGANSIAGATIVRTNDPSFDPEAAFLAEYGSYNTHRVAGMVSGGLTDDIAARVAMDYYGRDTFIDYVNSAFQEGQTDQDIMSFTGRAKLLWTPSAIPGLTAKLTYVQTQNNQPTSESAMEPYDDLDNTATNMPSFYQRVHTGVGDIAYEFANGMEFTNQTVYSHSRVKRTTDPVDAGTAKIHENTFSNESKLGFGGDESPLNGVAGIFYAHTSSDDSLSPYTSRGIGESRLSDEKDSLGVFAEADYSLSEKLTFTGGLRFQADWKQRTGFSGWATNTVGAPDGSLDYDETFTALLPKAVLSYDLTPNVTVGGLVSRGYNPGGTSIDFGNMQWTTFEEETLWDYEVFARANLLNDRLFLSGNLFVMDIYDAQLFVTSDLGNGVNGTTTVNASRAYSYGAEFAASYQILETVRFDATAGLLKTRITDFDGAEDLEGNAFANAPAYMLGFGATWDVLDNLALSANVRHTDGYFSDVLNTQAFEVDPYTIASARAVYQVHDHLQIYGYVDNIFDERVPTYLQNTRAGFDVVTEGYMTAPRMFGIGLKATF
ncbi:TonB-dependent receptor [Roseibium sp. RKSG952]|uniref:TonB-dependent receptor n=1 Tax=Roseibium sp. RKSG952 TaxID=2529384 RepID=UPI0018AD23BF|nr:TonB-dependent receptor [Roseibium sp. RKSG952]